jgi:hypothetical protein
LITNIAEAGVPDRGRRLEYLFGSGFDFLTFIPQTQKSRSTGFEPEKRRWYGKTPYPVAPGKHLNKNVILRH